MRKRFVVSAKKDDTFVAAIYAERFEKKHGTANFYIGDHVIATIELAHFHVADSGGVVEEVGYWWLQTEIGGPGERERAAS